MTQMLNRLDWKKGVVCLLAFGMTLLLTALPALCEAMGSPDGGVVPRLL